MASDTRKAAQALVERRSERFESAHPLAEARARLEAQLARLASPDSVVFVPTWSEESGRAVLLAEFRPAKGIRRVLRLLSVSMALLVVASGWAIFSAQPSPALRWLLPIFTLLAILGVPLAAVGLGSRREADESRIRKAIRVALLDEEERTPPAQRWEDED